jgi:hypothetical protein
MSDKHAQMREMARGLIRDSVIEDAIAQKIAQIIDFIHEDRIKPLQERVEMLERQRAMDEIADLAAYTPQRQVHWANDYYGISFGHWWSTREIADGNAGNGRIAVIRREWVPGQPPQYFTEGV